MTRPRRQFSSSSRSSRESIPSTATHPPHRLFLSTLFSSTGHL